MSNRTLSVDERLYRYLLDHSVREDDVTWFVSYALLGNDEARLYDASMIEWARRKELPMETKIKLCESC